MTARPPMRTPRRVPGFPPPQPAAEQSEPSPTGGAPTNQQAPPLTTAGTRQLSIRVAQPLHRRYRHLLRDMEDLGYETSLTELVNALLDHGPTDAEAAIKLLRHWRGHR